MAGTGETDGRRPVVLITGATSGLGRYLADELAGSGWQVVGHGRDRRRVADLCTELGHGAQGFIADLASLGDVRDLAADLRAQVPSRIVNVGSIGQLAFDPADAEFGHGHDGVEAYRRSKLALSAFTFDLADELASAAVTVNCLHPASLMGTAMVRLAPPYRSGGRFS